ncbi:MAG TPA: FISUMP domain-containing protein [Bacteroidales bacterium]|nr:FISUMP domain-containing protein [Bacteroidales bacterium]
MKSKLTLLFSLFVICLMTMGQRSNIELTFTAVNNTTHVQMDSIKIMNRTQGGETILIWPDTVLSVLWVGVTEPKDISGFKLYQNYPNPVGDQTTINLIIPEQGRVNMMVTDVLGRTVYSRDIVLSAGTHALLFTPGKQSACFLSAYWRGEKQAIKILHYGTDHQTCQVEYAGLISSVPEQKSTPKTEDFIINPSDELLYIGYAGGLESGMLDAPEESSTYTFQFATNIPCLGTPTVEYEGQVYNTIQIFSQCWLKENLNVGTMIPGIWDMSDNGIIEKHCYDDEPDSCFKYGGLYQWREVMLYDTIGGVQGICPPGWHLPTDQEWMVLEGAVDSLYDIGDSIWEILGFRGFNAGANLKTTSGWHLNGNGTDLFDFSGLPGGLRGYWGIFSGITFGGTWWTSSVVYPYPYYRELGWSGSYVLRSGPSRLGEVAMSVRCLRDY